MGFQYQQSQQVTRMHRNNLLESIGYCSVANINQWMMSIVTILWHGCHHLRHFNTGKRQRRSCSAVFCPALWCTKVLCCLDDPHRGASIIWTACNAGTLSWSGATARSVAWEKSGEKPWQSVADHLIIPTFNVDHHDQKTCPGGCALRRRCVNSYHKTNVISPEEKIFWLEFSTIPRRFIWVWVASWPNRTEAQLSLFIPANTHFLSVSMGGDAYNHHKSG